jgi:hypothetical protein
MIKMFHVERTIKTLFIRGFFVFLLLAVPVSCITPRHTVEIEEYILLDNGKPILGHDKGLTAFVFENSPKRIPFQQFLADKYHLAKYTDVEYWVDTDGQRLKIYLYENAELEKYFDVSEFMVKNQEPDMNIVGSKAKFLALSVINNSNEDCLAEGSLFKNIALNYLKKIKDEYNAN